jgi:chemotaxis protein methyltransferase CheR
MSKITPQLRKKFTDLISERTGLQIRDSDQEGFGYKIESRMRDLRINSPEEYYHLLNYSSYEGQQEWSQIALLITNIESYFFRDQGQFKLLREKIFPELIERKKLTKNLRVWSAGCSTGEEPYSLAILLREMLPDIGNWHLTILATDINQNAIKKAQRGVYNSWSFRLVDPKIQTKYFTEVNSEYQISREIRQMLHFQYLNLVQDNFPDPALEVKEIDLIICRNVFIYFNNESIALVLNKFYNTLNPLGFLLTGHAELYGQNLQKFNTQVFSESLIYQRPETNRILRPETEPKSLPIYLNNPPVIHPYQPSIAKPVVTTTKPIPKPVSQPIAKPITEDLLETAESLFNQKAYQAAIEKVKEFLKDSPGNFKSYYLIAKIHANMGQYDQAIDYCKQALSVQSFSTKAYYLLAQIFEEQGNLEETKRILKKIIYLDSSSLKAYFDLGLIYKHEGDLPRAKKMYQTLLTFLRKMSEDTVIPDWKNITVRELISQVEQEA